MSTRSVVGKYIGENKYKVIYVHFDGYLSGVGKILYGYYANEHKVDDLLELGDLSSIDRDVGSVHSYDNPINGWCVAYGRDRGEDDCNATIIQGSIDVLNSYAHGRWGEYLYVFKDNKWYWNRCSGELMELTANDVK